MVTPHPQVSVLMSVHNASAFLPAAIDSILAQTFSDFELIVVDDGSSDNSGVLLDQYAARDGRVRTIRRPNRGLTRSLNEAAARARGILLARMDGDDLSMPDRLARQVAHLGRHSDCVTVGGQGLFIDQDGWPVGPWRVPIEHDAIDRQHLAGFGGGIIHPAAMIRREAFERVGGYDEALPAAQDYDLWLRLAEVGRLANLPDVVLQYRLHLLSVTSTRRAEQTQCLVEVCRRARQKRGLASLPRRSQRRYPNLPAFRQRLQWVRLALRAGHFETARKQAITARREAPWRLGVLLHLLAARIAWLYSELTRSGTVDSRARGAPPAIPPPSVGG